MENGKKIVLIVEDEALLSTLMKTRLEKEGYVVVQAFDGEEAVMKVGSTQPDLIILDLILPKMSGFEFLESIKNSPELAKIPVVVLSNLGQDSDIKRVKQFGVAMYLVKARSSIDDVVKIIRSLF